MGAYNITQNIEIVNGINRSIFKLDYSLKSYFLDHSSMNITQHSLNNSIKTKLNVTRAFTEATNS